MTSTLFLSRATEPLKADDEFKTAENNQEMAQYRDKEKVLYD